MWFPWACFQLQPLQRSLTVSNRMPSGRGTGRQQCLFGRPVVEGLARWSAKFDFQDLQDILLIPVKVYMWETLQSLGTLLIYRSRFCDAAGRYTLPEIIIRSHVTLLVWLTVVCITAALNTCTAPGRNQESQNRSYESFFFNRPSFCIILGVLFHTVVSMEFRVCLCSNRNLTDSFTG